MEEELILRPRLIKRPAVKDAESANNSDVIYKKNTSRIFTQIYQAIHGGEVPLNGENGFKMSGAGSRRFSPDIIGLDHFGRHFTEVKAISRRIYDPSCRVNQLEAYCFSLLESISEGDELPSVDYAFFRYGHRNHLGWRNLNNSQLSRRISENVNNLTIVPLNLLFFLSLFLPPQDRYQTSSTSGVDPQKFFRIKGSMLRRVHDEEDTLPDFLREYSNLGRDYLGKRAYFGTEEEIADAFSLDKLKVEKTMSPPLRMHYYGSEYPLTQFAIARCFLPEEDYKNWLNHFYEGHEVIFEKLMLKDLFAQKQEIEKDEVPY